MQRAAIIMMLTACAGADAVEIPVVVGLTMTAISGDRDQVDTTSELLDVQLGYDPVFTLSQDHVGLIATHFTNGVRQWAARGPTVRITSGNKKTQSQLLQELFARVGPTHTVIVGRSNFGVDYGPRCIGWGHEYVAPSYPNDLCYALPPVTGFCTMMSPR
ncbi:Uncharacterised protein [Serratia fonticola]|uniref:Uncharacterized protein n=1 Tax=Serratia fonticola TaxID=47917 RepID=A0A3S4YJC7_SERFO|nr:Uncharacterised protein [Serratia fonticola]